MMRCPSLNQLPPPPPDKVGWPWTEESSQLPERMPDGSEWPRISIVTPSYKQGQFIEETIRSVLLQGYLNLEYIIIDGASRDSTIEVIKKYEPWLSYWHSKQDKGQSDALNQGFVISTGAIMGWLNSDDLLESGALKYLATVYKPGSYWWTGRTFQIQSDGNFILCDSHKLKPVSEQDILHARTIINQVSTFWTRKLWNDVGGYIAPFNWAMDYELWLRFSQLSSAIPIHEILGIFKTHENSKTGKSEGFHSYIKECDVIRLAEYRRRRQGVFFRSILIHFWTRYSLAKKYGWRSWIGRRPIPYV